METPAAGRKGPRGLGARESGFGLSSLAMPLIVDADNVLHVTGVLPPSLAGIEGAELIAMIAASRYSGESVTLVFDGTPRTRVRDAAGGTIDVLFSGGGRTADEVIDAAVRSSTAPRRLTVVSSDREVRRSARRRNCPVIKSDQFLARLVEDVEASGRGPKSNGVGRGSLSGPSMLPGSVLDEAAGESAHDAELPDLSPPLVPRPDAMQTRRGRIRHDPRPVHPKAAPPERPDLPEDMIREALEQERAEIARRAAIDAERQATEARNKARRDEMNAEADARVRALEAAAGDADAAAELLSDQIIAEAEAEIRREAARRRSGPADSNADDPTAPADPGDIARPMSDPIMPDDLLREAEAMLEGLDPDPIDGDDKGDTRRGSGN